LSFSRIYVLGAGAIGSIYGALLSEKNDVILIGSKPHVEAIKSKGLTIVGDRQRTFHPKASTEIDGIPRKSLVILTTKAYDSAEAVSRIRRFLNKDTILLVLQNGLGNEDIVKQIVGGRAKVLRALTKMAGEFLKPGRIAFCRGETIIESNDDSAKIADVFDSAGLKSRLSKNIRTEVWSKLVVNCVINPLTAILHVKNSEIWEDSLRYVRHGVVRECVEVASAEGIALPKNLAVKIEKQVAGYTNFSSMYQDLVKGKRTEINFLNGKVVELGKKYGVQTPINETLVSFIKFLEREDGISRND
jgi:2-dehydropantoate 2-reductase